MNLECKGKGEDVTITEIYERGKEIISQRNFALLLEAVETGFVLENNRRVLDRYTFRQKCIDAVEPSTRSHVLGVELATPVIMSAMTMPIPALLRMGSCRLPRASRRPAASCGQERLFLRT
jgi:hypothetical protein